MGKVKLKQNGQKFRIGHSRQFLVVILYILLSFTAVSGIDNSTETDLFKVSGHYNYPPYEFLDPSGEPTGFNVEIFNEVAKLAGLEVHLELGPWEEKYTALETGEIDVLIGMYFSASRAEKFDFTIPYETVSYSLFIRRNSSIKQLDDLSGKDIVLVEGGVSIDYINEQHFSSTIYQVASSVDALRLLAAGNYDCTVIPKVQGQYNIQRYGFNNIVAVGPLLLPRNLSFAVVKGKPELLTKLNEGLRLLKASGQLKLIHKKWIDIYEQNHLVKQQIIRFSIWIGTTFILLLLFSIGWVSTLRKRVQEKTLGLRQEIIERKQVEDALHQANLLQEVIYKIANAASGSGNLDQLFSLIRQTLHDVIDTSNFYIALIDEGKGELYFPYLVDEKDEESYPIPVTSGLTGYILRSNRSALFSKSEILRLVEAGEVEKIGTPSEQWLGSPLRIKEKVIGAIVVQSYDDPNLYNRKGLDVLEFVSNEIANAIHNKQSQETIIKSEEKYRVLSAQLTEANSMKKLLLDVITHDLKNPAGVISGMSEMLIEEKPGDQGLQLIGESCSNLLKVIDNAIIMSKVTLGEQIIKEDIDLAKMIRSVATEFDTILTANDMTFHFTFDKEIFVKANPIIAEVFKNYISNAVKYSADGKRIVVEIHQEDNIITVDYIDFGPTIPKEKRPLVFNRGVQLEKTAKHGCGLGLAIVKRIAEAHNAEVGVLPNKPNGNIFYFRIPYI